MRYHNARYNSVLRARAQRVRWREASYTALRELRRYGVLCAFELRALSQQLRATPRLSPAARAWRIRAYATNGVTRAQMRRERRGAPHCCVAKSYALCCAAYER